MSKALILVLPYLLKRGELPSSKLRSFKAFPYGVLSMVTYALRNSNHDVKVFDCNVDYEKSYLDILKDILTEFKPDIVGLSMMFDNSYKHVQDIIKIVSEYNTSTTVVMGGAAAVSSYQAILDEHEGIDGICYYEGEIPLLDLMNSTSRMDLMRSHKSWITRDSLSGNIMPQKTVIENLDDVIDIDYSLVDIDSYRMREAFSPFSGAIKDRKQFFVVSSRGCPFRCVFCMRSADPDKSMRYASVDGIIEHVRYLVDSYGMNILTFYDDQILLNKKRAKELFRKLAQFKLRIECPNGVSVAFIDEEMAELMRKAGMDTVNLAIESGSNYVLNEIIHKPLKLYMVKPVVDSLRKNGFWIHGFFVSGLPGEKDCHRDETVDFIKSVGLDWSGFSLAIPSRGSELYNICIKNGYIPNKMGVDELDANKYIIKTPDYATEWVIDKTYKMNLDVNFVNNHRMSIGEYGTAARAFADVIERNPGHAFAHYFRSLALEKMGEGGSKDLNEFNTIISNDVSWKNYADHFGIGGE